MPATPLTWSDWPAPRRPARSLLAAAVILAAVLAISGLDPWLAVVGAVILVIASSEVLLPTTYALSAEGVTVQRAFSRRTRPWTWFVGFRSVPEGFVLEGRGSRPVLRRHRTLLLRCVAAQDQVASVLARHVGAA